MSKREMPEPEPLNLVPIMNLVTILIPVLLMAIKSLGLAVIDTSLPAISTSVVHSARSSSRQAAPSTENGCYKSGDSNLGCK